MSSAGKIPAVRIEIRASGEWLEQLDQARALLGISRAGFVRMAVNHQLQALEPLRGIPEGEDAEAGRKMPAGDRRWDFVAEPAWFARVNAAAWSLGLSRAAFVRLAVEEEISAQSSPPRVHGKIAL